MSEDEIHDWLLKDFNIITTDRYDSLSDEEKVLLQLKGVVVKETKDKTEKNNE